MILVTFITTLYTPVLSIQRGLLTVIEIVAFPYYLLLIWLLNSKIALVPVFSLSAVPHYGMSKFAPLCEV